MRAKKPSQTASMVALFRALADRGFTRVPGFSDPMAASMLTRGWRALLGMMTRRLDRADRKAWLAAVKHMDVVAMRVAILDAELTAAVARGCRQVVILGAGLDTRAYRMAALEGVHVLEIDHPATQAFKRERVASLPPRARVTFVSVDFERESLATKLAEAGHRDDEPTAWIWEGVVMYLTDEAVRATLDAVGARSAPESTLLVHYHVPGVSRRERPIRSFLFAWWGEPQIGLRSEEAMRAEVERAGFTVERNASYGAWASALGAEPPESETADITRFLVARRRGPLQD